jgi:hypothetical protein
MIINTILYFYTAIQSSESWFSAILSLCGALQAFSFARLLRLERISCVSPALITTQHQNQMILVPILTGNNPNIETGINPYQQSVNYSIVAAPDMKQ